MAEGVAKRNQEEGRVVSGEGWRLERDLSSERLMPTEAMRFRATALPLPPNSPPDLTPLELISGGDFRLTVEDVRYPPRLEAGTKESFSSSRSVVSARYGPGLGPSQCLTPIRGALRCFPWRHLHRK